MFPLYLDGLELNGRMRAVLVDWLVQVHARFQLLQETLYMCVAIMDRYLQVSCRLWHSIKNAAELVDAGVYRRMLVIYMPNNLYSSSFLCTKTFTFGVYIASSVHMVVHT